MRAAGLFWCTDCFVTRIAFFSIETTRGVQTSVSVISKQISSLKRKREGKEIELVNVIVVVVVAYQAAFVSHWALKGAAFRGMPWHPRLRCATKSAEHVTVITSPACDLRLMASAPGNAACRKDKPACNSGWDGDFKVGKAVRRAIPD